MKNLTHLLILFCGLCAKISHGQEQARDTTVKSLAPALINIEPIRSLNKLSLTSLQNQAIVDVNDALALIPGVQIQTRGAWGAQGDLIIDGSTFEQTMLSFNGIKLFDVQTGHNTLSSPIPFCAIDNIKINRGAQSPYRGVGGLAGSIDFQITPKQNNYIQSYISSNFKKDSIAGDPFYQAGIMGNIILGNQKNKIMLSAELDTSSGYRENSRSGGYKLSWVSSHKFDETTKLDLILAAGNSRFDARDFYVSPFDFNAQEQVKTNLIMATFHSTIASWFSKTVFYNRNGFDHYVFTKLNPSIYQNFHNTNTAGIEQHFSKYNRFGDLELGIELRNETISSTNLGNHNRRFIGFLANQNFEISKYFAIKPAIYAAYSQLNDFQVYPGLDVNFSKANTWTHSSKFSIARGMRNPSFTDLYYEDSGNKGNPDLVAENGYTYTLDYSMEKNNKAFRVHSYYRDVENYITWTDINPSPDTLYWYPQNNAQVGTYGIGAQINLSAIKLGSAGWYLSQNLGYQYNDVSDRLDNTKNAISILQHQLTESIGAGISGKFWWNWTFRWQQQLDGYDYSILDTRFRYIFTPSFSVYLDGNNLLDEAYNNITVAMPGRHFRIGFIWNKPSNR